MSPLHFHDPGILQTVHDVLGENALRPHALELEITESPVQSDTKAMVVLQQLQGLHVRISIDGFGTGYSALVGHAGSSVTHSQSTSRVGKARERRTGRRQLPRV